MWILTRYLSQAILVTSLSGIAVFVFLLITGNAMKDMLGLLAQGYLPLSLFAELILLLIPYAFSYAMPLGVLIAILLTMGRLSANQELTALKAAGVSLYTIAAPVLFVALCGSLLAAYINAIHAPAARASYRAILNDLVRNDPLRFIVPRTFIHEFPGYILYVGEKEEGHLRQFWLWELDQGKRAVRLLRAEEGTFAFDEQADALILTLKGGFTELRDPKNPDNLTEISPTLSFREARIRLPMANLLGSANRPRKLSYFPMEDLFSRRDEARAVFNSAEASPEERAQARVDVHRIQYYVSRHFAMAFSVFSLALFAIPLGIRVGRSETYANFTLALVISMAYYMSLILIEWAESSPALRPELLVWLPNLLTQAVGAGLLVRANRH